MMLMQAEQETKMKVEPCRLPDLTMGARALDLWNAAMTHAGQTLPLGGGGLTVTMRPVRPARPRPAFLIHFEEPARLLLQLHEFPFEALYQVRLTCEDVARMPGPIRTAIERGMLDTLREWLPPEITSRIRDIQPLSGHRLPGDIDRNALSWLQLDLVGPSIPPLRCSVGLHPEQLAELLGISELGPGTGPRLPLQLKTTLRIFLGTVRLSSRQVGALAPGDLLVLDRELDGTVLYVTAGRRCFVFAGGDDGWTCRETCEWPMRPSDKDEMDMEAEVPSDETDSEEDVPSEQLEAEDQDASEEEMDAEDEDPSEEIDTEDEDPSEEMEMEMKPDVGSPGLPGLPVVLSFEIGEMEMPYSEIEEWRPGSIVSLNAPQLGEGVAVRIRANGHRIATGDLVRLGNRLAIRIHSLANTNGTGRITAEEEDI